MQRIILKKLILNPRPRKRKTNECERITMRPDFQGRIITWMLDLIFIFYFLLFYQLTNLLIQFTLNIIWFFHITKLSIIFWTPYIVVPLHKPLTKSLFGEKRSCMLSKDWTIVLKQLFVLPNSFVKDHYYKNIFGFFNCGRFV